MLIRTLIFWMVLVSHLVAAESESSLQAQIIGKVVKFITWENESSDSFIITVLNNPFGDELDKHYKNSKIKGKKVDIRYIKSLNELGNTDLLYVSNVSSSELESVINRAKNKNILTMSDVRGFAEKDGVIQVTFVAQKPKLKINLARAKEENLQIKSSLLQIAEVIKG